MNSTPNPPARSMLILGALLWGATMQYFFVEAMVIGRWRVPYSRSVNFISDLGAVHAGIYPPGSGRFIDSPWHALMNGSFILQGVLIAGGAIVLRRAFGAGARWSAGIGLIVASGAGVMLVGLFPEDVDLLFHSIGAGMHFVAGNLGLILLSGSLLMKKRYHWIITAVACGLGVIGLVATIALFAGQHLGLGAGGIERVAAYPLPFGLLILGARIAAVSGTESVGID